MGNGDCIPLFPTLSELAYVAVMKQPSRIQLETVMIIAVVGGTMLYGVLRAIFVLINR